MIIFGAEVIHYKEVHDIFEGNRWLMGGEGMCRSECVNAGQGISIAKGWYPAGLGWQSSQPLGVRGARKGVNCRCEQGNPSIVPSPAPWECDDKARTSVTEELSSEGKLQILTWVPFPSPPCASLKPLWSSRLAKAECSGAGIKTQWGNVPKEPCSEPAHRMHKESVKVFCFLQLCGVPGTILDPWGRPLAS